MAFYGHAVKEALQQLFTEAYVQEREDEQQSAEPVPRPPMGRTALLRKFNNNLNGIKTTMALMKRSTTITGQRHSSWKSLAELTPITLNQMKVPMVHKGHVLACRVLTEAIANTAIETICEDITGQVQMVSLYNFNTDFSSNTSKLLKPGMILLIKEPFLKYSTVMDATEAFIRVDSPSDVTFVHETEKELLEQAGALCWYRPEKISFESLKQMGNDAYGNGNFTAALSFYRRALSVEPKSELIRLNMAAAFLQLGHFYEADKFASEALAMGGNRKKAFFRLGKAAYGMCRWRKAIGYFQLALAEEEGDSQVSGEFRKAEARLTESLTGNYDLKMLHDGAKNIEQNFDVADFVGKVEIADVPGRGKGLVVTDDVKRGTLLLVSKAYARFVNDLNGPAMFSSGFNSITDDYSDETQIRFIIETVQKLKRNPQTAKELYALFAGDSVDRSEEGKPLPDVLDTGRIERICSLNGFGDMDFFVGEKDKLSMTGISGLWLLPSYINHRCIGNVVHVCYGDILFIYAKQDLAKGDELFVSYVDPTLPYKKRAEMLKQRWAIDECDCRLCQLDKADPEGEQQREELAKKSVELQQILLCSNSLPSREVVVELLFSVQALVFQVDQSYGQGRPKELCFAMSKPLRMQADSQMIMGGTKMAKGAVKTLEQMLEQHKALGWTTNAVQIYWIISKIYLEQFKPADVKMAKEWADKAFNYARSTFGIKEKELFVHMYPRFAGIFNR